MAKVVTQLTMSPDGKGVLPKVDAVLGRGNGSRGRPLRTRFPPRTVGVAGIGRL